jgi:hypothetical protein
MLLISVYLVGSSLFFMSVCVVGLPLCLACAKQDGNDLDKNRDYF